jgi:hypothetical protein
MDQKEAREIVQHALRHGGLSPMPWKRCLELLDVREADARCMMCGKRPPITEEEMSIRREKVLAMDFGDSDKDK